MAHRFALQILGLTCLLVLGSVAGRPLQAQDRGAPRFGPAVGDTLDASATPTGRLWSVYDPPFDRFEQRYEVEGDTARATHLRRSLLRLPECTASFVSSNGLALTAAGCVRRHLDAESPGTAIVAADRSGERAVPGLYVDRLVGTSDVTARVRAAQQDMSVQRAVATVQRQLREERGPQRRVEVVPTAGSAPYTAYTYRRYTDVRVAFLPESSVSAFGGIGGAMTYPRPVFDAALLRVYTASGRPLTVEHALDPATEGVRSGSAVFAAGYTDATHRAKSAEQLAAHGALTLANRRALLKTWTGAVRASVDTAAAASPRHAALWDADRIRKATDAQLQALRDEYVTTWLKRRDRRLRRSAEQPPQRPVGGLLDSLAALQEQKRALASAYRAFGTFGAASYTSTTFRRMMAQARGTPSDSLALPDRPASLETALLAARLDRIRESLAADTTAVRRLLGGESPSERAASIVAASRRSSDSGPAAEVAAVIGPEIRQFYEDWQPLRRSERRLTRRLAGARQAAASPSGAQALDGVPRLTDGRVLGYPYNGTTAAPLTTIYGLFGHSRAFGNAGNWRLPERWHESAPDLDRSVPLTFAASTDPVAAPSGAPLVNSSLELVGVAVDTNIQGAAAPYVFLPERMRTVALDLRALREGLTTVYDAEALVDELFGGPSSASRSQP